MPGKLYMSLESAPDAENYVNKNMKFAKECQNC